MAKRVGLRSMHLRSKGVFFLMVNKVLKGLISLREKL